MVNGASPRRAHITVRGAVQGVGFRPYIYRLATELNLAGWVNNSAQGVFIEVEGDPARVESFLRRIEPEKPPLALIQSVETAWLDPAGYTAFEIRRSDDSGGKTALILPDVATCPDCLRELFDPANHRYRYPFTNCTNCGPRFTIVEALPYDRPNTTMKGFSLCPACRAEYENPLDRRFHAQPNACPVCGPRLELWNGAGTVMAEGDDALICAAESIRQGWIVAVKGLGGFHLMVDARSEEAVRRLRARKSREEKPFALMCPSLDQVRAVCEVSDEESRLLESPEAPIMLLHKHNSGVGAQQAAPLQNFDLAPSVAPGNPNLGVMLPYTPVHHLLLAELGFPVVATSGNRSDEPICTDEREALDRLRGIADVFLVHNRPIARHVDDSVVRVILDEPQIIRRARGYAPLPVNGVDMGSVGMHSDAANGSRIAVGAHLKNAVAASAGGQVFVSQHIGDLDTPQAFDAFRRVIRDFQDLYDLRPAAVACDLHPDYLSTQHAESLGLPLIRVQHHYAHVLSCLAENGIDGPVLGISWDGTGYGTDGTIWGGEFLRVDDTGFTRAAHLRTFRLPGGDLAVKEPRRAALGVMVEVFGDTLFAGNLTPKSPLHSMERGLELNPSPPLYAVDYYPGAFCRERGPGGEVNAFSSSELPILRTMLAKGLNAPITSSAGRLFDAVAALVGLRGRVSFEGQAAMELEFALAGIETDERYEFALIPRPLPLQGEGGATPLHEGEGVGGEGQILDWEPTIRAILDDVAREKAVGEISAKFHNTLVEMIVAVAERVGEEVVALTGGCFQNRYLTERAVRRLRAGGFRPCWHRRVPPNDGGIALGQIVAAGRIRDELQP